MRHDAWRLELLPVIVLLGAFGIYAGLRAYRVNQKIPAFSLALAPT
jgi:hypothetical protein